LNRFNIYQYFQLLKNQIFHHPNDDETNITATEGSKKLNTACGGKARSAYMFN